MLNLRIWYFTGMHNLVYLRIFQTTHMLTIFLKVISKLCIDVMEVLVFSPLLLFRTSLLPYLDHVERKVPKYENHKLRERKVKTLTRNWRDHKRTGIYKHAETVSRYFDWHGRLCRVFTNIYSLSIEKDGRASRNIWIQFPCVCVCLSFCDLFNSW